MDLTKAIYEFLVATLPAVFLYFLGWAYLYFFLGAFGINISVFHRTLPDLQRMKLCYSAAASSAPRSVFSWCD